MFYILFFMSYVSAGIEMTQACNGLHDYLMEVNGCFKYRASTIDRPVMMANVRFYPCHKNVDESLRLANSIKETLCTSFLNVSGSELEKRIDAFIKALDLNIEFIFSIDNADEAVSHLLEDAHGFLHC